MNPAIVESIVKRHMKSTEHFVAASQGTCPIKLALRPGETVVGWYTNPAAAEPASLVFTGHAIYVVRPDGEDRIELEDLSECSQPDSKISPTGIAVRAGERSYFLPAAGCHGPDGKFKDAYNLFAVMRALVPDTDR